jgi:ribose 5-phosphate isomerase A
MIVVVDAAKLVDRLGTLAPLPVEIVPFGWQVTFDRLMESGVTPTLRCIDAAPFVTDGGNYIVDCVFPAMVDPTALQTRLATMTGIVESGLFIGLADTIIVGGRFGAEILER